MLTARAFAYLGLPDTRAPAAAQFDLLSSTPPDGEAEAP